MGAGTGISVGVCEGADAGKNVGMGVGTRVGNSEGADVGEGVGAGVGENVEISTLSTLALAMADSRRPLLLEITLVLSNSAAAWISSANVPLLTAILSK